MSTQSTESELVFQVLYQGGEQVRLQAPFVGEIFSGANAAMVAVLAGDIEGNAYGIPETGQKVVFFQGGTPTRPGPKVLVFVDGDDGLQLTELGYPDEYGVRLLSRSERGACPKDGRQRRRPTDLGQLADWERGLVNQAAPVVY